MSRTALEAIFWPKAGGIVLGMLLSPLLAHDWLPACCPVSDITINLCVQNVPARSLPLNCFKLPESAEFFFKVILKRTNLSLAVKTPYLGSAELFRVYEELIQTTESAQIKKKVIL